MSMAEINFSADDRARFAKTWHENHTVIKFDVAGEVFYGRVCGVKCPDGVYVHRFNKHTRKFNSIKVLVYWFCILRPLTSGEALVLMDIPPALIPT